MKKMLLATVALAVVIASPAFAKSGSRKAAAPIYGQAYAQSPDAGLGGDYVGTDPDPNVRLELLKDAQSRE